MDYADGLALFLGDWCCLEYADGCDCDGESVVDPGDLVYNEEVGEWMEVE